MTSRAPSAPLTAFRGRKAEFTRLRPLNRLWRLPAIDSAYAYARARANIPKTKTITSTPPPSHAQTYPESSGFPAPSRFSGVNHAWYRSAAEIACPGLQRKKNPRT